MCARGGRSARRQQALTRPIYTNLFPDFAVASAGPQRLVERYGEFAWLLSLDTALFVREFVETEPELNEYVGKVREFEHAARSIEATSENNEHFLAENIMHDNMHYKLSVFRLGSGASWLRSTDEPDQQLQSPQGFVVAGRFHPDGDNKPFIITEAPVRMDLEVSPNVGGITDMLCRQVHVITLFEQSPIAVSVRKFITFSWPPLM